MEENLIEVKKKNKILPLITVILVIILLAGGGYYYYTNYYNKNTTQEVEKPRLEDDFYDHFNTKSSPFYNAQQESTLSLEKIIVEIDADTTYDNKEYRNYIETFEDYNARDKNGINELKPYFDKIDEAKTIDDFSKIMIDVYYDLDVNSFLNVGIEADQYNNSRNVILIGPMELESLGHFLMEDTLPSGLDIFVDESYSDYKKAFEKGRIQYFMQYGYDKEKATKLSNDITEFAKQIQSKSVGLNELYSNVIKYYKNVTKTELKKEIKNLPIDLLLNKFKINNYPYFAVVDLSHLKELDSYYNINNLPLMKEILKLLILEKVASLYSSSDYAKIYANVFGEISKTPLGFETIVGLYEDLKLKPSLLGDYFNEKFDAEYYTKEEKDEIRELIVKIKDHYVEVIQNVDWLDENTKTEAIKKLNTLKINIGFTKEEKPEKEAKVLSIKEGGTVLSNYIIYNKTVSSLLQEDIKKPIQPSLEQYHANAFYNPSNNSINFPVGFKFIYKGITGKYAKYAYVGTIVAHEISHAFDNNGSQYDEKGNVKNWWTEDDKKDFDEKKQKIADYYSKYEIFGVPIDGNRTVGENIADLAAIKTIISIMESENATNEDYKTFFESFVKLWSDSQTKSEILDTMVIDNHSPNKIRVNAVLSSMDKFYEVYGIKEGDKMFVPKEERVGLW